MRGKLIVIEGTDCSGKETQVKKAVARFKDMGINVYNYSFPMYDTPTGRIVGGPYLGKSYIGPGWFAEGAANVDALTASAYYAADRRYNIGIINKHLEDGDIVILDRYVESNMAHQGGKLKTREEREKMYHPDSYIYLADKRQELHFTQVFRVAKKAGIVKPDADMTFLGFGTMNGNDGKPFKTRSGGVMRLENLIADIQDAVYGKITENRTMDQAEARDTARIVGLAALKYGDLSNQASKDYVFDVERFTSFEGNTGPYILYTIVRIKSILAKYVAEGGKTDNLKLLPPVSASEKNLELALVKYLDVMEAAYMDKAPHKICQYIYEISNVFNGFYHDTKILAEQDKERKESYISLISLTKDILLSCIDLLGIECPERM